MDCSENMGGAASGLRIMALVDWMDKQVSLKMES